MQRIVGFDIGSTSIGWAVIDWDRGSSDGRIVGMGCRIFPEARDPKGTPWNQTRRQKRMVRRQLRRRRARRRALNEALTDAGLLPPFSTRPAKTISSESDPWHRVMRLDPLELRARGLGEKLEPHELGRALYHLAQRRHFRGRDLEEESTSDITATDGSETSADEQQAATDREATLAALKASGQTLGQFLFSKSPGSRRRGIHAHRSVVAEEFGRLWQVQAEHHPQLRDAALRQRIEETIFAQRPVFWRRNTLGDCRLMPGEALCPKGSWLSQQRRMLEKLNNLALVGGNARPLDAEERTAILARLQTQAKMGWAGVRAALRPIFKARGEPGAEKRIRFNLEEGGDSHLPGNGLEAKLAEIFGDDWESTPHRQAIRDAIHERLWSADYGEIGGQRVVIRPQADRISRRAVAAASLVADFALTPEQAAAVEKLNLPTGWEPFSSTALRHFMPHLERGERFGALLNGPEWTEWRDRVFPDRLKPTGEILDRLPSPTRNHPDELKRIATLRNPTVVRVQNELRKVVNNLVAVYGKPDLIRIELAREVGKSKREREEMQAGQRRREAQRKKARADLAANGIAASDADIEKWLLWKECGEFDPYSGQAISFDALFRTGGFDVEHVWPRGQCFDDSFANKTLCLKSLNHRKANKTPFEAFGHDSEWEAMKERMWKHVKERRMAAGKAKRFCREEPLPEDFAARQLNDTGFAARQALAFLKRLWPDAGEDAPATVQAVSGRVVAQLRKLWGLNYVLAENGEKTRADHRHHAIDALVAACAHPGMTQSLSRYWQAKDAPAARPLPPLDPPWASIRADAERAAADIVVSHRVRKKVSGPLHEEMPLGYTRRDVVKNGKTLGIYVKRMPVEKLSLETLKIRTVEEISRKAPFVVRDEAVRAALLTHLEAAGTPPEKAYVTYPRVSMQGPEIKKVRVLTGQQKELMRPVSTGYADPANNHHINILKLPNGKIDFEVVSLFDAAGRLAKRQPIVRRERGDGAAFVMSLSPGDALEIPEGNGRGIWIVQGVWASGQIVIERANDAAHQSTTRPTPGSLLKQNARKVSLDPIGRIRPAND